MLNKRRMINRNQFHLQHCNNGSNVNTEYDKEKKNNQQLL